jgi:Nucleotidyl transferase AbiEii toxin, Type IV TA system
MGGYRVEFKLISKEKAAKLGTDIEALRRNATVLGAAQERIFKIEISKYEYCRGKVEAELDAFTVFVYSPEMIAAEKLRAICQQMPDYPLNPHGHARARDFYDIHTVVTRAPVDIGQSPAPRSTIG